MPIKLIDILPAELLGTIFELCVPRRPFGALSSAHTVTSPKEAPLILTQVCSTWRTLAINAPSLWTQFVLQESVGEEQSEHSIRLLPIFIKRSQELPFSFHLVDVSLFGQGTSDLLQAAWTLLGPIAHRIQILDIARYRFVDGPSLQEMGALCAFRMALHTSSPVPGNQDRHQAAVQSTPRLRAVIFDAVEELDLNRLDLPWHQLKYLELSSSNWPPREVVLILQACSALVSCYLCIDTGGDDLPIPTSEVRLQHLTKLKLVFLLSDFAILENFRCPSLRELDLEVAYSPHLDPHDMEPITFIQQYGQNLKSLRLRRLPLQSDDLRSCLEATSSLVHLGLPDWTEESDESRKKFFLSVLVPQGPGKQPLLPALKTITLSPWAEHVQTGFINDLQHCYASDVAVEVAKIEHVLFAEDTDAAFAECLWAAEAARGEECKL